MTLSKKNTVIRTLHKFADSHHYARTLIMLLMMMAWGNSAWAEFKNFSAILNKQSGTMLLPSEYAAEQTTVETFGIAVDGEGKCTRVAADDPNAVATVAGKYWNDHGMNGLVVTIPNVSGTLKITTGNCQYGTDHTVKDAGGNSLKTIAHGSTCFKSNASNVTEAYVDLGSTPQTIKINGGNYCGYVKVEKVDIVVNKYNVTYVNNDAQAVGTVPAAVVFTEGDPALKSPKNFTLYKEGYTLTGWKDVATKTTYNVGDNITPTADMTLNPEFKQNTKTLGDRTEAVTMIWDFQTKNGAPTITVQGAGKTGIWVTQATVNGETIDVKLDYDATSGKLATGADWCQINTGTILTFPSCENATATAYFYAAPATATVGGQVPEGANTAVTITSSDATQQLVADGTVRYIKTLTVVLPEIPEPTPEGTDIFTMNCPTGDQTITAKTVSEITPITVEGGSAYVFNNKTSDQKMITSGGVNLSGSGDSYLKIVLDSPIQEGDEIKLTANDTKNNGTLYISPSNPKDNVLYEQTYTVTYSSVLKGASTLYFWKNNEGANTIQTVTITRPSREGTHQVSTVISPAGTGKITIDKDKSIFSRNTAIVLTAVPNPNYSFVNWTNSATGEVTENPYNYTTTGSDVTITANFQEDASYTTVWDFKTMASGSAIQNAKGNLASNGGTLSGTLEIDATNGKFQLRGGDAQFNANTIVQVPVNAPGDLVTINSSTNALTVAGVQALGPTTYYTVSACDMATGYIDVVSTNGNYLYDITVKHSSPTDLTSLAPIVKDDVVSTESAVKDESVALSFSVENADQFQWYENSSATNSGGTLIKGATNSVYKPSQSSPTTKYYYCVATNSKNDGASPVSSSASTVTWAAVPTAVAPYDMKVENAAQLLYALKQATGTARYKIFLADGDYNLGDKTLNVVKSNVSLIGQSKTGVIIRNKPRKESINGTAVFLVTGSNVVMQDLTIKCEIVESAQTQNNTGGYDERGVCIQDEGSGNVYRNIRLLGRQDTYYSRQTAVKSYFENCEIYGTVDFICGDGDVWFEGCQLKIDNLNGAAGAAYITAPSTKAPAGGYVFNNCTISNAEGANMDGKYYLGRAWQQTPKCHFYKTTKNIAYVAAWGPDMTTVSSKSMEEHNEASPSTPVATIGASVTASAPLAAPLPRLIANTLTWAPVDGAVGYAIYKSGVFLKVTTETSIEVEIAASAKSIGGRPRTLAEEASLYSVASISSEGVIGEPANAPISNEAPTITTNLEENYRTFVGIQTKLEFEAAGASEYHWYISDTKGEASTIAIETNKIDAATSNTYIYTPTVAGKYYLCCKTTNVYGDTYTRVTEVSVGETPQDITLTWPMVDASGNLYKSATSSVDGIVNLSDAVVDGTIVKWNESKQNYAYTDEGTGYYGQVTMISGPSSDNTTVNVNAYVKYSFEVKNGRTFILNGISGLLGRNGTDAGCAQLVVKKGSDVLGQTSISQPNRAGKSQPSTTFSTSISDVTCVENDVIDLYVYWGGTGKDKSYGLKDITITGKYTKEADTASPTIDTDVLDTPYAGMPDSEVNITIAADHYTNIQWYKNTTNSNTGGTKVGDGKVTLSYTPTSAEHGQTLYFYAVVSNDDATGAKEIKTAVATVNVGSRTACDLLELKLSNGFNTFINDADWTVKGYYMSGLTEPTIASNRVSPGATYNKEGNTITVTAEDGTTKKTYTYSCESIAPLTSKELQTLTIDTPSWLKGGGWHTSGCHEVWKSVEDGTKRISLGRNRVYLFVGPCEVFNLTVPDNADRYNKAWKGTYTTYVNGEKVTTKTVDLPKYNETISIPCSKTENTMIEIVNDDLSNSWGFSTVQLSSLATITFKAGSGAVGTAPADVTVPSTNGRVAIPANSTLYKPGYTLTGWTDSSANHYDLGKTYTFTENTELQAEWRENKLTLSDLLNPKVEWKFGQLSAPLIHYQSADANYYVMQNNIMGQTTDLAVKIQNGKFSNYGRTDALIQCNNETELTFDAVPNASFVMNTYEGGYTIEVWNGDTKIGDMTASGKDMTYTVPNDFTGSQVTLKVKATTGQSYISNVTITYPTKSASDLTVMDGKEMISLDMLNEGTRRYTLTKDVDYTTSNTTGRFYYTSSDESVVTVSDAGVITAVAGGDAKVTVQQTSDATHAVGSITFDVHVKAPVVLSFDGVEKTAYSGERIGTGVIPEGPAAPTGQRFHGWFTSTDGNGERASEVYVVKKATEFHPYFMDIPQTEGGFIMVPTNGANNKLKGDALLNAIEYANEQAAGGQRKIVFIPNGTYDLGTQVLSIVGSNVSLIGESMEGVIIQNEPSIEGLDNTATFKVTGDNVVMQNLTIKNRVEEDLDGTQHPQGVCIEDAGAQNVYREVRLLGMQNTYYASDAKVRSYFENSEIHGTVDIVGGNGDVWFEGCDIKIEPANVSYIAAPATTTSYGFIFNGCTISSASTSMASKYYLGRGYTAGAKAAFHNTTKTIAYKETGWGKNIVAGGTFVESASAPSASVSSVVTNYTNDNKLNAPTNVVLNKESHTLTWNKVANATAYIIYKDGKRIAMQAATNDETQSYVIPQAQQAKGIKARSMTTAAAIEGGYSVASVSATGIIGDAKAEAQIPAITKDIAATTVYVGKAQTFAIEATDATSYQWYKSNSRGSYLVVAVEANKIVGATSASYSYTATEEGTVYLVCKATNAQGSAYSTVIPVTAQNPVITQNLNDKYGAVMNTEKTFNVVAEGGATYQWYTCADATGANPKDIKGATSSMLTQTWDESAVGKSYYIYCKVNGVVNSAITTVTVAAAAEGGKKTYHADGTVFETYDFASLVAGGAPNLSIGSTPINQAEGTNPLNVYVIDNPKGTVSAQTLDLNGRFAVNNKYNSGEQLRWMWRSSTNAYQNGLAGNWNNKGTAATSFNMSILGLYKGDKVTVNYSVRNNDALLHAVSGSQANGLAAGATIVSKTTYTMSDAIGETGNGQLDLYCTNNNMAIQSITIESHYYATSEPVISTNLPAAVKAYKDVPRVLSVAASDADSYQWYKATSAEASAKTTATPIEGANDAAYVYTPTAAGAEYYFCVVSNANGSKSSDITTVTTVEADVKTFDFLNMDENDKTLVMSSTKTAHKGNNGANNNYDIFTLDYPRDLRGYMAIQNANIAIADAGLKVVSGSGNRVGILTGLAEGDVVTFIGTGLNGNVGVESGANSNATCTVMTTGEVKSIQMTSAGDLNFWLDRYGYGVIKQIIVTRKTPPVFTQNLNEKYFVTTGGALTLNITASNADTYQWYSNTHASNMGGELIPGATTASYTPATSANGTGYYYCVATNAANNTVAVSNVAQVDVANVVFRDFELDVRQKRDYGLTEAEAVQGQTVDFGILVDEDGTLTRVAETTNVNVSVHGTYESTVLGLKNATFTVPVQGKIKFSIGKTGNDDKAKDYGDVIVKDAAGNTVATLSTKGGKWSSNKKNVIYGYYTGPSTTLTFTTSAWVPYIRVEKVEVAELNAPTITQTTFDVVKGQWAVTMATNVDADGARIYYTTDGTDPTVGSTLYNGTAYVAPGTTIKAIAVCDGWYASGIGNRTTSAQPETKGTEVISYHNGETGDNIGMTYTVAASYNAGKPTGEDGLKMNLTDVHNEGDNAYTVNGFRINVNNGYRITGINLNDVNFTYTKIYVDGVVYGGALNALNATQTIDFECEGSTPIDTKITLSYEFADDVTGITVNGQALTADQVTAFKNKTLSIDTQYKGAPEVVVTTALGYTYTVDVPAGVGTTYTYGFTKVGDCQLTFTNVLKSLPVITFNERKFYFVDPKPDPDGINRGKGYNFEVSGETGGTYTITIDGGAEQAYDSSKKYYAIETATVQYSNADESYPKDVVTAHVASTDFDKDKPFAVYLYAGGYTDQNMEPKPLEAKMILEGIGETYNVVLTNKGDLQLTGDAGIKDLDNLGKADLIVLSEAMSSSEKLFQTFDYKNGTTPDAKNVAKQLGLGTTNVLNFKIFAAKESVWNWATPEAVDTKNISFIPSNPLYSVFNGVHFNDDANHTIDLWNDNHAPLLNHMQGVWKYVTADGKPNYGPQFVTLATAQASSTQELDVLQFRYSTSSDTPNNNKVFVNFGLNINDYSAYDENVKTIVGNICRMINAGIRLDDIATSLTQPVITDNGDGSAKIMTSTSMATIKYVTYDAEPGEAPTAKYIKDNGEVAVNGMTKQFATNKVIYAIAMMSGMDDSEVSEAGKVKGSPLRKITRRALHEDDVTGVEVTQTIDRNTPNLKVPYNQTYKKEGYTVTSWIDSHTGTEYFPGETLVLDQDLDLVAQWTKNIKSVTDLCGGPNEQRTATFNFLMKDGAPEMKLDGNFTGVLVGQVRFSNERGDFIDVVAELSGRETLNPQSGRTDAGKLQNNFTNSWNWLSGDGTQIKEYCQIKTGTVFTFPAVSGMTVNFKATDLERDEEASHQVQVHRSFISNSVLTDGTITNPAYTVDVAGNYILTNDNFAEGGNFSYSGQASKTELVVRESSMVYERPSNDNALYPKENIFEHEPGWNDNSVFMDRLTVTYPALYKVTPKLDPAISEIVADGSEPTANITYSPAPAKNADGKFTANTAVKMIVTPTYAYRYDTSESRKPNLGGTVDISTSGEGVPEDGAVYSFTMPAADKELPIPMVQIPTRVIQSSPMPRDAGRIVYDPDYTSFADGKKITLTAMPKVGYEFIGWSTYDKVDFDNDDDKEEKLIKTGDDYVVNGRALELTVNATTETPTHYAQFQLGKQGTVNYKLGNAVLLNADGTTEKGSYDLTDAEKNGFPTSMTKSAMIIPTYYTMYKEGYTLDHWVACDADGNTVSPVKRYDIGTYYYFDSENEVRNIKPVFKKNKTKFDYRTTEADITWDFRTAYFAQSMEYSNNVDSIHYSTHSTFNREKDGTGIVTMDVPLVISTGNYGKVNNQTLDEWCTLGEGTEIRIPSGLDATFTLASYSPITSTKIDDDVLTNYVVRKENNINVYVYTYKTKSPKTYVTLTIGDDFGYYKYIRAQLPSAEHVDVNTAVNIPYMGVAEVTSAGTIPNGDDRDVLDNSEAYPDSHLNDGRNYYTAPLGSYVTFVAKRNRLYEFDKWLDADGKEIVADGNKVIINTNNNTEAGGVTSTLIMQIEEYLTNVKAVFKERSQYQVNYTAGKLASGIAPAVQVVEKGETFTLPSHNQVLYYEGHTLKYWLDEDGNRYDFGQTYTPQSNLYLSPVFEPNEFAFSDILNDVTMTWPLAVANGATDINFRGSSGIIVDQMEYEGMKIDMKLDIKSSSTTYRAYNNTNDDYCLISDGINIEIPSTPGCKITLNSYSENVSRTEIAGATSEVAGANTVAKYSAGLSPTVIIKQDNTQGAQTISFKGDSPSFTSISVTYTAITGVSLPELTEVTIGGVAIGTGKYDRYSIVDLNSDKVLNNIPVEIVDDKMPEVVVTRTSNTKADGTTSDEITYVQATVDNPTATIILKSAHGIIAGVYKLNFRPQKITGSPTLEKVNIFRQDREGVDGVYVVPGTVAPNSMVTLTFNRAMAAKTLTADDITVDTNVQTGTFHGTIHAEEGKDLKFSYWDLDLGKTYKFTVKANTLKDIYGNYYDKALTFQFTISDKLIQNPDHRPYDFVVTHRETFDHSKSKTIDGQRNNDRTQVATDELIANLKKAKIPYGTIDEAIAAANAQEASAKAETGKRTFFRIFVPDGEYQIGGNYSFNPGRDFSENKDTKVIPKSEFPYNNGETYLYRPRTSIIGQSQDKTVVFSDPYFYGISYTSTIEVRPQATDCYFQDLTFDNRYSWHQMSSGTKPGGQCAAFFDRGQRTILKNVGVLGYQDSYVSDASNYAQGKSRCYYETSTFAGTVDFLCGDGDMWWEQCKFLMRYRGGNNFIAPCHKPDHKWGYVFNNCVIDAEDEAKTHAYQEVWNSYQDTYEINNGNYHLGRPWENSPYITLLNTQMIIQPNPEGWMNMKDAGLVLRFHELGSTAADGSPIDLSTRTTRLSTPGPGSYDVVMTQTEAAAYTMHEVLGGGEGYDPKVYTAQMPAVTPGFDDTVISWRGITDALCYAIFKSDTENGEYKLFAITSDDKYDCGDMPGWYKVRTANQRGGLGEWSKAVQFVPVEKIDVEVKFVERNNDNKDIGWSTVCLPFNAKVPDVNASGDDITEEFKVYAAVKIADNTVTLQRVHYITAGIGYVIYGTPGIYTFKGSSHTAEEYDGCESLLDGNPTSNIISAAGVNCYTLSYKPNVAGIGFYKFTGSTLAPYKAYLTVDTFNAENEKNATTSVGDAQQAATTKGIRFVFRDFRDEITGIYDNIVNGDDADTDVIYDLSGRRVHRRDMIKGGIYIVNGRKVAVKK